MRLDATCARRSGSQAPEIGSSAFTTISARGFAALSSSTAARTISRRSVPGARLTGIPPSLARAREVEQLIDQPRHPSRARDHVVDGFGPPLRHLGLLEAAGGHQHRVQRIAQIVTENGHEPLLKRRLVTKRLLQRLPASDVAVDREQHQSQDQQTTERRDIDPERGVEIASRLDRPPFEAAVLTGTHFGDQLPHAFIRTAASSERTTSSAREI